MSLLFGSTLFLSAFLLFLVQPLLARMILPLLGGTPAVWTTCILFFQVALLAGYGYAHAATAWLGPRPQVALHVGLVLAALLVLPIDAARWGLPPAEANPIGWLLALLLASVGLPALVTSSSTPLLQRWFAGTGGVGVARRDPYPLYAASNLGSLAALLAYPVLIEPRLRLASQSWLWALGYAGLGVLTLGCAVPAWRAPDLSAHHVAPTRGLSRPGSSAIPTSVDGATLGRRLRWIAWAFVPSSLMLGVTTYLTTEVAAAPLLWVVPLAIYLLTYVLAFGVMSPRLHQSMVLAMPVGVVLILFVMLSRIAPPLAVVTFLHLGTLFLVGMVGHGELVRSRPDTPALTTFYLCIALGGALGGLFHAVVAPLVFSAIVEYPLTLVLACLLLPPVGPEQPTRLARGLDVAVPLAIGGMAVGLASGVSAGGLAPSGADTLLGLRSGPWGRLLIGLPAVLCYLLVGRPLRFGLAVGAVLLASTLATDLQDPVVHRERSFFGVHQIRHDRERRELRLYHGTTVHGMQSLDPRRRQEPLAYYHPTGPIGQVFQTLRATGKPPPVAIVGLGAGALAAYGAPGQAVTFYEIDPAVARLAVDPRHFTYLRDAETRGVKLRVVLGDARLRLAHARDREYGLIVVDAFTSHAIPVHLLTREALGLYLAKLTGDGLLALHLSNPHLRLERVLGALARDAALIALLQDDRPDERLGKAASTWAVLARQGVDLGGLARDPRWRTPPGQLAAPVWTDDFSNLLGVLR